MIYIESKENTLYKEIKKLKIRKNRNKSKKYLIEGFRLVEEALKAKANVECILCSKDAEEKVVETLKKYNYQNKLFGLNDELFKEIAATENPQGIIATVNFTKEHESIQGEFYVLCDKVQDPGNLGTIIRTAHAAGIDGVILTKGTVDVYNEKTIRSTMGSIFYIPIIIDDNLSFTMSLKEKNYTFLATSLEGKKNFFEEDLRGKIVVTVGNEGNGVSEEIYALSDKKVKIPMPGNAESLNVGVAASIVLYERVRQNTVEISK